MDEWLRKTEASARNFSVVRENEGIAFAEKWTGLEIIVLAK